MITIHIIMLSSRAIITILNVLIIIHNNFNINLICINNKKRISHGAEKGKRKDLFIPTNNGR